MPLYLATDNRNIENGDYPVRKGDMDHLEFIKLLLDKGANVNARLKDSTETRTVFTNQWLDENGATAFLRASQSGDLVLMKLLLARGADPKIKTELGVTALHVAAGIGWVEGITYEWSPKDTLEAVRMLLDLGLDPNAQADTGRVALHGAAHKGATEVVQLLVDRGARLDIRDYGNTDNRGSKELATHTWLPVDYADGLVRVGVQSAIPHPETGLLLRKLMTGEGPARAARRPHAGIDLHHRGLSVDTGDRVLSTKADSSSYTPRANRARIPLRPRGPVLASSLKRRYPCVRTDAVRPSPHDLRPHRPSTSDTRGTGAVADEIGSRAAHC